MNALNEWRLVTSDNEPGSIQIAAFELTKDNDGQIVRWELSVEEMERLHTMLTKALWYHVRLMQ